MVPITDSEAAYAILASKPFMTYWRRFFKVVTIIYLTILFIAVQAYNCVILIEKFALSYDEIIANYPWEDANEHIEDVEDKRDLDDEDEEFKLDPDFNERKYNETKIGLLILISCLFMTNYLTYRAHLVTIQAFKSIKMQNINVEGFKYNRGGRWLNILFIFS